MKLVHGRLLGVAVLLCVYQLGYGQAFIHLSQPTREQNNVNNAKQYISGRTCKGCRLQVNGDSVHVYTTGSFAIKQELKTGRTPLVLTATDATGKTYTKHITYYYQPVPPPAPTPVFRIDYFTITPQGNLQLTEGDTLRIRMKAFPGCQANWINNAPLQEVTSENGTPGFYEGAYVIKASDSLLNGRIRVSLRNSNGTTIVKESPQRYSYMPNEGLFTGRTIDNMTYLTVSPHGDRLGPQKLGYLDEGVLLQISGREGNYYKVRLAAGRFAYIPEPLVDTATLAEPSPVSIVNQARVWADEDYDYVSIPLANKLPYISTQEVRPGRIIVDIFGAYAEAGLQSQIGSTLEIQQVAWQQPEPEVFRTVINLRHAFPWGYKTYYQGDTLTIQVKRTPDSLQLRHLTIGLDAGHGGSNVGALGPAGVYEKELSLSITMLLKAALEKRGATVLTTRTRDQFVANEERLSYYRRTNPDLLLSIHLNSSINPVDIKGTATYYKHPFCEPLARAIYNRMLETGLSGFGCNGDFNFILNNPTEFPDALVETLFISNPGDEEKVLDPAFQAAMVEKIIQGLEDYLAAAGQ
ncbi:N-acetylmuramoyl-L-alanine amidase [uncultured Chitinophaga sp.]|uniref:N-acetylmuramoyl-L-alanine amidase n=1 Tax=uncultured Chitinophaga sp. TaxID=339340 RepID=UPI00262A5A81|nr:N-acetylmuramoyl-L-alanine amidase [uncultured Chitinophaga sp.]